jgi:serine/threonine protein kinase/nucleotide-binding universal stress UspA family protein
MNNTPPKQTIQGFVVHETLHAGSMALVYKVEYDTEQGFARKNPGFEMVMKIPRMQHADGGETIIGFEIERQILPALHGAHVPRFVAAGDLNNIPYLVMEYIAGRTLESQLDNTTLHTPAMIARLGAAIANAIHSLHQQHVCHLDLKPANIMFRQHMDGSPNWDQVVLLDFGLSCHAHFPDLMAEELRQAVGSPAWIAPEQVVGVRGDPRSDIFALGVILYELTTGQLPFGSPMTSGGLRQRLWMTPIPPRVLRPDTPEWLQEIILRCLEANAEHRYPSAAHLAFDLHNPLDVQITNRGRLTEKTSFWTHFKRWIQAAGMAYQPSPLPEEQINAVPIVMVAIPAQGASDATLFSLRQAAQRSMGIRPGARLAVVTVVKQGLMSSSHVRETDTQRIQLNILKTWAAPLDLNNHQTSFHVLESNDIADALLKYAGGNNVSLIIMGAATNGLRLQRFIRTVPIKVTMSAPCSVMLVKANTPFEQLGKHNDSEAPKEEESSSP